MLRAKATLDDHGKALRIRLIALAINVRGFIHLPALFILARMENRGIYFATL